ncbi:MAG: apolipoprotein N-acyltransferase [Gammaproteobacteria bacterium]|nr:apolipoprotein N-acyltransferase [Gammaproteobacteria bacterium]
MNPAHWPAAGQMLLAFVAGATAVLAFAPFGIAPLAVLAVALLFYLWRHPARDGLNGWTGYAFGLGLMGFGVSWIRISIAQFGGVNLALALTATLLFVLFMALYFALAGWLAGRMRGAREGAWLLATVPALWLLVEWLRGWFLTGFPWLAMGYSQIAMPLAGYAPLGGVYAVSLAVALSAALLNLWPRLPALLALLALWAGGAGLQQLDWVAPAGEPLRVSLLQGNIAQEQKWLRAMRQPSLELYLDMTAAVGDSDLVIWPETAVPAFASEVEQSLLAPLDRALRGQGRDVLLGIVDGDIDGAYYNAMMSLGVSGRDRYHKRHLVPFGEYLPLDAWTRPLLDFLEIPMSDFARGDDRAPLITLAGHPAGINICYEDAYGNEVVRGLPAAAFLVNASNDAWFGDSLAPHQHLEIARMRALETGRFLLRATNTGISAIIDEHGGLRGTAPQFDQAILTDDIVPLTGRTPFTRWGNVAVVALALVLLGVGAWRQRPGGAA